MMRLLVLAAAVAMAACAGNAPADDAPGDDGDDDCAALAPAIEDDFAAELAAAVEANTGQGGGILRIECRGGGVMWEGAAGDVAEAGGVALRADDAFEIQSTTKAFTAALALTFVEDGSIGLDDPVGSVLPAADTDGLLVIGGHDYGAELTLRQLLAHTAGLPDYWNDGPFGSDGLNDFQRDYLDDPERVFEPRELIAYAKLLAPIARPGVGHHYSDTGYVLVGLMIEALGGAPYHQVMRDRILAPLGMTRTYLRYRETPSPEPVVAAWYDDGELVAGVVHQTADWAGGGLVSTAADLATFLRALFAGGVVHDPATLVAMRDWTATDDIGVGYGLGLYQVDFAAFELPAHGTWEGHDGYGNAFMYAMAPDVIVTGTLNSAQADWGAMVEVIQARLLALRADADR
jgi:D-alanyl-D-alanine carboxypeptidase